MKYDGKKTSKPCGTTGQNDRIVRPNELMYFGLFLLNVRVKKKILVKNNCVKFTIKSTIIPILEIRIQLLPIGSVRNDFNANL